MPQIADAEVQAELVCSKAVEMRTSRRWDHWLSCDVKNAVQDFLKLGHRNFSLKIVINDHSGRPLAVVHPNQSNDDRKPFIEVCISLSAAPSVKPPFEFNRNSLCLEACIKLWTGSYFACDNLND